jgi:hypothetical protein
VIVAASTTACCTDRVEELVARVLDAVQRGDRVFLKEILHPYLHWSADGVALRGRVNVLAHLAVSQDAAPPTSYELRDGQIYRWNN